MSLNDLNLMAVAKLAANEEMAVLSAEQRNEIQDDVREMLAKLAELNEARKIKGIALVVDIDGEENNAINASCGYGVSTARNTIAMLNFAAELAERLYADYVEILDPAGLLEEILKLMRTTDDDEVPRKLDS